MPSVSFSIHFIQQEKKTVWFRGKLTNFLSLLFSIKNFRHWPLSVYFFCPFGPPSRFTTPTCNNCFSKLVLKCAIKQFTEAFSFQDERESNVHYKYIISHWATFSRLIKPPASWNSGDFQSSQVRYVRSCVVGEGRVYIFSNESQLAPSQ